MFDRGKSAYTKPAYYSPEVGDRKCGCEHHFEDARPLATHADLRKQQGIDVMFYRCDPCWEAEDRGTESTFAEWLEGEGL
jgi:hypothetical protein